MNSCTSRIFAPLLALALLGPVFGACVSSSPLSITGDTGGSTGSGSTGTGGAGSGAGGQAGAACVNGTGGAAVVGAGGSSQYANFATIGQIVNYKCGGSSCHNSGTQAPTLVNDSTLYSTLTTAKAPDCMNYSLVNPGSPEQSALYLVLAGPCGCVPQMPNGCTGGDPTNPNYSCIPPDYIEGVREWIANGATQQ
jgi:hypothetical protein